MTHSAVGYDEHGQLLSELETAVSVDLDDVVEFPSRRPPYDPNPVIWTEWHCPICEETFAFDLERCPRDLSPLVAVQLSQPFLWIG